MGCPSFQPEVEYPAGSLPVKIAAADFNGDGSIDLAFADRGGNIGQVTILFNNGAGVFNPGPVTFPVGLLPSDIKAADFNGDGFIDLAITNEADNNITILLNNGAGVFTPAPGSPFPVGTTPTGLTVTDFNGDGFIDIAVANLGFFGDGNVTVLLNNGSAMFSPAPGSPFFAGPNPFDIVSADFNGDGSIDLAVTNINISSVSILLNDGSASFALTPQSPVPISGSFPIAITAADLTGDGSVDLATANPGSSDVSILLNNGSAVFTEPMGSPIPIPGGFPFDITNADFNCDGIIDLATANAGSNDVSVLINNGFAMFTETRFAVGNGPEGIVAANLNGDGRPDLAVANTGSNTVSVLLNNCLPAPSCPANITVSIEPGHSGAYVNFAAVESCPGISVVCNPPSGSFFRLGTTTVTCTATDVFGNTATCSFTVKVQLVVRGRPRP